MSAPDAPAPQTNALRQAFRALVPRPVRAALHGGLKVVARAPGAAARQVRRAGWAVAQSMSPPRQPGLFFWHMRRTPSRLAHLFRRRDKEPALDEPSFQHALLRLQRHDLGIRSIVNIGAGSGGDTEHVQRIWPGARTLLVEMDARFEPEYRKLKAAMPDLVWDICAAGPHDEIGRMQKADIGGVGGALDLDGASSASLPVQVKRIDTLVREHGLAPPYFLRFDTHGFELDILAGAKETLRETALIQMEVYNFKLGFTGGKNLTFDEMSLHMKSLGFRCVDLCDPLYRPGDRALWQMHLFFIRADHPLFAQTGYAAAVERGE